MLPRMWQSAKTGLILMESSEHRNLAPVDVGTS